MFYTYDLVFEKNSWFQVEKGEEEDKEKEREIRNRNIFFSFYALKS